MALPSEEESEQISENLDLGDIKMKDVIGLGSSFSSILMPSFLLSNILSDTVCFICELKASSAVRLFVTHGL